MKPSLPLMIVLGVSCLTFTASSTSALQVGVAGTYSCTTQSECKSKCEALGGRWQRKKDAPIRGNCYLPSNVAISDQIGILQKKLDLMKRQKRLIDEKRVFEWPSVIGADNYVTEMELKPSECIGLGGEIHYSEDCPSQVMCSTEVINPQTSESKRFFQCVD